MSIGLLGRKLGMTRLYDEKGRLTTATVIEAAAIAFFRSRTRTRMATARSRWALATRPQRVGKAQTGHFAKTLDPQKFIREFGLAEGEAAPRTPTSLSRCSKSASSWMSSASRRVRVPGCREEAQFRRSASQPRSMMHRRNGAIGNRSTPGRVWKNRECPAIWETSASPFKICG
jgi:large subunit ribosomal protein L3